MTVIKSNHFKINTYLQSIFCLTSLSSLPGDSPPASSASSDKKYHHKSCAAFKYFDYTFKTFIQCIGSINNMLVVKRVYVGVFVMLKNMFE